MYEYKDKGVRTFLWVMFSVIVFIVVFMTVSSIMNDAEATRIENLEREYYRELQGELVD